MSHTLPEVQRGLWERIEQHAFDPTNATFTFEDRLMQENGWTRPFARRAIAEYRRYAFIAAIGEHRVSPPDVIDQVWHLHLLYTRNYWDIFCKQILGRPLHHEPASGAEGEQTQLGDSYVKTLASYERLFGAPPSTDIWPSAELLARTRKKHVRADLMKSIVVPRAALQLVLTACVAIVVLIFVAMAWFASG